MATTKVLIRISLLLLFTNLFQFEYLKSNEFLNKENGNQMFNFKVNAPKAKKIAKELKNHNVTRNDAYYWMNERDSKDVLDYLNAENSYFDEVTKEQN